MTKPGQNVIRYLLLFVFFHAFTAVFGSDIKPGDRVIIMIDPQHQPELVLVVEQWELNNRLSGGLIPLSSSTGIYLLNNNQPLIASLRVQPWLIYAGPDREVEIRGTTEPNDPLYFDQWGLEVISAPQAWTYTTGGNSPSGHRIVAAIYDNGCDILHEDLEDNIWINHLEIPGTGADDDSNGYIDDVYGWNLDLQSGMSHQAGGHGTAMTGVIGAHGNNGIGVSGVNWNVDIMILSSSGPVYESSVVEAYEYIRTQRVLYNLTGGSSGALVVAANSSFGINQLWAENAPHWCAMYDALGEAGILSAGATANMNYDVDIEGDIPSTCPSPYLLTVTETNRYDAKASTAAYGKTHVDLGAPGDSHLSTRPGNLYATTSGTSTATAFVTGAIALLASFPNDDWESLMLNNPPQAALLLKEVILRGVDPIQDLQDRTTSGGRLNLHTSMQLLEQYFSGTFSYLNIDAVYPNPGSQELTIRFTVPEPGNYSLKVHDLLGRSHLDLAIKIDEFWLPEITLNTAYWPAGVYLISMNHETGYSSYRKWIKQH